MSRSSLPRLAPIPKEHWGEDARDAMHLGFPEAAPSFLSEEPDAPRMPNVLGTMMHHPALAAPFLVFNRMLLRSSLLEPRLRELMVLRVAWRSNSTYEWAQHVRAALKLGITAEEIKSIAGETIDASEWSSLEADLLAATDQLLDDHRIDDETWARLAEELDEPRLVEVVFVVGTYTCLAMAFNSFGLQLDPGIEPEAGIPLPE